MPEQVTRFPCPYLNAEVELTLERERHIGENHPDLLPEHRSCIAEALADPDQVRRSLQLSSALLFSKRYEAALDGKSIVVVVMAGAETNPRSWIVTAYITRKLAAGETEWKRD